MSATTMQAIVNHAYGPPDDLKLQQIDKPEIGDDGVLVRVRAASVNPLDWHFMRGQPYVARSTMGLRRPKVFVRGVDVAGEVEAVGANVAQFQRGDAVFGECEGTFAEYASGPEMRLAPKPVGLTFEQAAAVPIAGCTALQALRDHGQIQAEQQVLINGASGGVGTFAVQLAKAFGAEVTGVCSTQNVDLVSSIGADNVVDYTQEDFTRSSQRYDLILDLAGNHSLSALRHVLAAKGTLVLCSGTGGKLLGPLPLIFKALVISRFVGQRLFSFLAHVRREDLLVLKELIEAGKVTPVIDRTYRLNDAPKAIRYLEAGHPCGKIVITE
jgi:NADPH:quinone reductase-like Zn-dependent oxidoreductase